MTALYGSDLILHAGDIGDAAILDRLRQLAPVVAVRGNIDRQPWCAGLADTEVIESAGLDLFMLHDLKQLDLNPARARFAAVIYGHSHRPAMHRQGDVLYSTPAVPDRAASTCRFPLAACCYPTAKSPAN